MKIPRVVNIKEESCDVFIGRPSKWGNPFKLKQESQREYILILYADYIIDKILGGELDTDELRGKVLGCYCKPKPCHGDVLLKIANNL